MLPVWACALLGEKSIINSLSSYRLFGGLILDAKRKLPFYWSDIRDSLSLQCLASILFLYCACMSPVITFGGLLGEATHNNIVSLKTQHMLFINAVGRQHNTSLLYIEPDYLYRACYFYTDPYDTLN